MSIIWSNPFINSTK
jgi:hypothetical protein